MKVEWIPNKQIPTDMVEVGDLVRIKGEILTVSRVHCEDTMWKCYFNAGCYICSYNTEDFDWTWTDEITEIFRRTPDKSYTRMAYKKNGKWHYEPYFKHLILGED